MTQLDPKKNPFVITKKSLATASGTSRLGWLAIGQVSYILTSPVHQFNQFMLPLISLLLEAGFFQRFLFWMHVAFHKLQWFVFWFLARTNTVIKQMNFLRWLCAVGGVVLWQNRMKPTELNWLPNLACSVSAFHFLFSFLSQDDEILDET